MVLKNVADINNIEENYSNIKLTIKQTAREALGTIENKKKQYQPMWQTEEIIEVKRKIHHKLLQET